MIPDRSITRRVREYDRDLFIVWNNEREYFELWRHMAHGRCLITPIVQLLFEPGGRKEYAPLDERLLWLIAEWDSWRNGGPKNHVREGDRRWLEFQEKRAAIRRQNNRDYAKDAWHLTNNHYMTRYTTKNSKPLFNNHRPNAQKFIRPDVSKFTSSRLFARSAVNARAYFGDKK